MSDAVLVHSPLVGPATMRPLAAALEANGWSCVVPDLRGSTTDPHAFLMDAARAVRAADVVIGHSGAGVFLPAVTERLAATAVYVDAVLPDGGDRFTPSAPFVELLGSVARADGSLPPWHEWWPPELIAELLPDPAERAAVVAEIPSLPRSFYDAAVRLPPGWSSRPAGYLQLSPAYDADAERAALHGWPVVRRGGHHLDLVSEPVAIGRDVMTLVASVR